MEIREQARTATLQAIVSTTPKLLWERLIERLSWAYAEAYASTKHNPLILPDYARFRAAQERHFLVEYALSEVAKETGANFVPEVVAENAWRYGILSAGSIALTQKCVTSADGRPPAAEFRKRMAETGGFVRQERFAFVGVASKISGAKITAVLVHAPESRNFNSDKFGKPAFINFAVAWKDYADWAVSLNLAEIVASYVPVQLQRKDNRPDWKKAAREEGGQEGA